MSSITRKMKLARRGTATLQARWTALDIRHLQITKAHFAQAPIQDRTLYFQLGLLSNDIGMFRRVMMYALNGIDTVSPVEHEGRIGLVMMAARFTAGRLHEGNGIIHTQANGGALERLASLAPDDDRSRELFEIGIAARKKIARYFSKKTNIVSALRNKLAFHSNADEIERAFLAIPNAELTDHLSSHVGSSFFGSAEVLSQQVMINLTGQSEEAASLMIREEVMGVSGLFEDFTQAFHLAFAAVHAPDALAAIGTKQTRLHLPRLASVQMPFFASLADGDV